MGQHSHRRGPQEERGGARDLKPIRRLNTDTVNETDTHAGRAESPRLGEAGRATPRRVVIKTPKAQDRERLSAAASG